MKYIVEYKVKWETDSKEIVYKIKDEVLSLVKQVQMWLASIDWKIIVSSIEDFEIFKITEQNYDQINDDWKHLILNLDWDWFMDVDECTNPYKKDITNKLFNERVVSSKKKWSIHLHKLTMSVLWEYFPLKSKTKLRQTFEILITAKHKFQKNNISYEEMEEIFSKWNFSEMNDKDFNYIKMRDILKDKLREFKYELNIDVLKLDKKGVKINI